MQIVWHGTEDHTSVAPAPTERQDMHRVLKLALKPWPTLAGMKSLIEFDKTGETYFRADNFCKMYHDNFGYRDREASC